MLISLSVIKPSSNSPKSLLKLLPEPPQIFLKSSKTSYKPPPNPTRPLLKPSTNPCISILNPSQTPNPSKSRVSILKRSSNCHQNCLILPILCSDLVKPFPIPSPDTHRSLQRPFEPSPPFETVRRSSNPKSD